MLKIDVGDAGGQMKRGVLEDGAKQNEGTGDGVSIEGPAQKKAEDEKDRNKTRVVNSMLFCQKKNVVYFSCFMKK